jgi:nitroreductase
MSPGTMRKRERPRATMARALAPDAGLADTLTWALAHACAAPSELNSQPWQFTVCLPAEAHGAVEAVLELRLDVARRLATIDPDGREAHLACGAALLNLRLALRGAQLDSEVVLRPDADAPELLARIEIRGRALELEGDRVLRLAIPERATHRGDFEPAEITGGQVSHLVAAAAEEGAPVAVLDGAELTAFEVASASAQSSLWADGAFRREVAQWTISNHGQRSDGVPGSAYGLTDLRAPIEPLLVRLGFPPKDGLARDDAVALRSPLVLVLGAADDSPSAWLRAGAGMQRLLLTACASGISASFLNAVLHRPSGKGTVARLSGLDHPQVVLRLGYGMAAPETPRRAVDAVHPAAP